MFIIMIMIVGIFELSILSEDGKSIPLAMHQTCEQVVMGGTILYWNLIKDDLKYFFGYEPRLLFLILLIYHLHEDGFLSLSVVQRWLRVLLLLDSILHEWRIYRFLCYPKICQNMVLLIIYLIEYSNKGNPTLRSFVPPPLLILLIDLGK